MKKILVTGGVGFIGSHIIERLLVCQKFQVTCFDNLKGSYAERQSYNNIKELLGEKNFTLVIGDICRQSDLDKIGEIDIIIHLAAITGVRESILNPLRYMDININGTKFILEFARIRNIPSIIFASSSSVYGNNPHVPWKETHTLCPINPYAYSKLKGESLGKKYSEMYGIQFIALRLFTVYGPRQRPDLAICKFFNAVINGSPVVTFGFGYTLRDYTYIDDIVNGFEATVELINDLPAFDVINLGRSIPVMLKDLIVEIEEISGKQAILTHLPEHMGDAPVTFSDISKARSLIKYDPKISIKEGLKLYFQYLKPRLDG